MNNLINTVMVGVTTFVATNIDDIVILMLFFSQVSDRFRPRHIVIGQYLGFAVLIAASLPGFLGGMLLPKAWIGLLGLIPIIIGLRQFWQPQEQEQVQTVSLSSSTGKSRFALPNLFEPQIYHVAAVTIANGGDNISIYVPLFANSSLFSLITILIVFLGLVGIWCYLAYWLSRHRAIAPILTRYGHRTIPFVLIGLGIYILVESKAYRLLPAFS
jgi:cadmium resistance transport/sequestration family protein